MQALLVAGRRSQGALGATLRGCGPLHGAASYSSQAAENPTYDVPAGHANSDLSPTACNIRLARRRDLKMRQDLRLHAEGLAPVTLSAALQGKTVVLLGLPRAGEHCKQFVGDYVANFAALKQDGVDKVMCVSQKPVEHMSAFAQATKMADGMEVWSDMNGGFTRMMGMEIHGKDGEMLSQRYACIIDDGILLKTKVEAVPTDIKATAFSNIKEALDCINN